MRARPDLARQHACGSHAPCPAAAPCSWALLRRAAHACAAALAAPQAQRPLLGMKGSLWLHDSPKQRHIPAAPAARSPGLAGEEAAQRSNFVPWWHGHAATPAGFQPSGESHVAEPSKQNNEAPDGQVGERKAGRRASKRDESDWAAVQAVTEEEERTREIKRCQTWRELQQLFHSHDPSSLNPIHVSALIVGLRTVVPSTLFLAPRRRGGGAYGNGEDEGDHGAGEEGADDSDELASAASSSRRRRIAGAGAGQQSLGRRAARERREILAFAQEVLAASLPLLPRFHPYELTAVLHTLAKAGLRPPDRWLRLALETAHPQLEANRFTNQQLGLLIWSLATLQVAPPPRWLVAFCYASERRMHKPQTLCRKELVTLSWGLATLKFPVPASWGTAFLKQLQQHAGLPPMPSVSSDSSSTSAAAQPAEAAPAAPTAPKSAPAAVAATLEVAVTAAPAAAAAAAAFSSSTSSTSTSPSAEGAAAPGSRAAAYAPGWAKKGGTPAGSDVAAVNGAGNRAGQSGAASADERRFLCNCIWAAGALRLRPDATWLMAMTRRCQVMLPACNSWELSVLLWGLGAMGHVPPTPWVQQVLHALYKNMAYAEPEHLARTLYSLAAMGARVGGPPQGRAAAAQGGGSGDASGKGVEGGDASSSGMRGDGSRERGDAQALAGRQQAQDKGQERQDGPVRAPRAFFVRFFQHTHLQLFDFDALSASTSLWALATLQVKPPRDWLDVMLMSLFEQSLSGFGPQELSMSIWALAEFGYRPHQAWMDMFWSQSLDLLPAMTPQHLVQTLRALIKLGRVPPQEWLDAFIQASTACMDGFTLEGQALLLRCFASVERSPGQAWLTAFFSAFMRSAMPQPPALVSAASGDSTHSFGDFSRASGATQAAAADEAASSLSASYQAVPDKGEPPASFASDLHPQPVWHEHPDSLHPAHTSATGTSLPGDEHSSSTHDPKVGLVFEHVAWSLGRLHVQPPEDWTRLFLERAFHAMPHFRQGNLAGLLYGLRVMDLRPSQRWVQRAVETVDAMIEQAGPTTGSLMRRPEKRELSQKVKLRAGAGQESTGQGCSAVAEGSPPSRLRAVAGLLAPVEGARGHKLAPRPDRVLPSVEGHSREVAPSTGGTQGRLNSVSFRKLVWGIEKLSPEAHARWTLLEIASL